MFRIPECSEILSMRMSRVLADIGVDERIVMKRRRTMLLIEAVDNETEPFRDNLLTATNNGQQIVSELNHYYFGSRSEGTTTLGLESDIDILSSTQIFNLIQDWSEWEPNVRNYLMIQDENVSPGYCLLQRLRTDAPLPEDIVPNKHHFKDRLGRVLLGTEGINVTLLNGGVIHGPAHTTDGQKIALDVDTVPAFRCRTWPLKARFTHQDDYHWPSEYLRRYLISTGCFVVPVGSKGSELNKFEWRISTSLAERCLMFNLNITQLRCYVLMKMILKTFINPYFKDTISSYMCKTVLFHCISNTHSDLWKDRNLYFCLLLNLVMLYNSVINENCPHFFIPENNLLRGKILAEIKPFLLRILQYVIDTDNSAVFQIKCDDFGSRLYLKCFDLSVFKIKDRLSGSLLNMLAKNFNNDFLEIKRHSLWSKRVSSQKLAKEVLNLVNNFYQSQGCIKKAKNMLASALCTTIGSMLASRNIQEHHAISAEALTWISIGLNTDVASSKLKLASMLYCTGELRRAELVLREIEKKYDLDNVEPICGCHKYLIKSLKKGFNEIADKYNEEALQMVTAFCVSFASYEMYCVPQELRFEMFRSTQEDLALRNRDDKWMDFAVVDSLPYLYFLQYKTYRQLRNRFDKQRALSNFIKASYHEPNLGHRETALNLLGQCMEEEGDVRIAAQCYLKSLNLRGRNNAAKMHLCRLVSSLVNGGQ